MISFSDFHLFTSFFPLFIRDYTAKAYLVIQSKLVKKALELGTSWTAENVGKCIWIVSIFSSNKKDLNLTDSLDKITKRKRGSDENIVENETKNVKEKKRK